MSESTVFKSNKTQAIRLPKTVAMPDSVKKVTIIKLGRARLISPAGEAWDSWFDGESTSTDFMQDRDQPEVQERDKF